MLTVWIEFISCALIILYAGAKLSQYGDIIAEKTGLGRAWIGIVLLASITSLPELSNNISSVVSLNAPDLALGDLFGSCLFNIVILAILDILYRPGPILRKADLGHILSAGLGMVLIGVSATGIIIASWFGHVSIFNVGIYSCIIALIYLISQRMIFQFEKKKNAKDLKERVEEYGKVSFNETIVRFVFFALIVILAGSWLPTIGQRISEIYSLSNSFVGSIFLAAATSLPEIAVSVFAMRLGAIDMAVGNIFGSNVFNMFIIFIDDIFYKTGPILAHVSPNHIFTALLAIILTSIAVIGLIYRSEKKLFWGISWDSLAIITAYFSSVYFLYRVDTIIK